MAQALVAGEAAKWALPIMKGQVILGLSLLSVGFLAIAGVGFSIYALVRYTNKDSGQIDYDALSVAHSLAVTMVVVSALWFGLSPILWPFISIILSIPIFALSVILIFPVLVTSSVLLVRINSLFNSEIDKSTVEEVKAIALGMSITTILFAFVFIGITVYGLVRDSSKDAANVNTTIGLAAASGK